MDDALAPKFGLPPCLWIPIAARDIEAIERFVGKILERQEGVKGRVNAILAQTNPPARESPNVKLWSHPKAALFRERLYPEKQVWVHVDYAGYRKAYLKFGAPLAEGCMLDHVQNREAIRLRDYSHPYLRLSPVSRLVNTNGGARTGGEGMEKQFLRSLKEKPVEVREQFLQSLRYPIVYADPMDLTKMLDITPGTQVLDGVRETQELFYPE